MDAITQAVLGAAVAQTCLYQYDKERAWLVGGLAGMAADLDILIRSSDNPMLSLLYHRHFTHSLAFVPLGALLVALALLAIPRFRPRWRWVLLASFLGYATHGLLDACTSYGTVLYWPFSDNRISWDIISIVDPFFTFPLILGLYWSYRFKSVRGVLIGLCFAFCFLAVNAVLHQRALQLFEQYYQDGKKRRVFPELASSRYWRSVWIDQGKVMLASGYIPLFGQPHFTMIGSWPHFTHNKLPQWVKQSPTLMSDYNIFKWFSDGYLIAVSNNPLQLVDVRFVIQNNPPTALWGIEFLPNHKHIKRLRFVELVSTERH